MGIRRDLDDLEHAFISIRRAVELLVSVELMQRRMVVEWLLQKHAYEQVQPFVASSKLRVKTSAEVKMKNPFMLAKFMLFGIKNPGIFCEDEKELSEQCEKLRWQREEFWQWVQKQGIEIQANMFEDPLDCPKFLRPPSAYELAQKEADNRAQVTTLTKEVQEMSQRLAAADALIQQLTAKKPIAMSKKEAGNITTGLTITLPHTTKTLDALFEVICANWTNYDKRYPPKSTVIAAELDKKLGWQSQGNGTPSRSAQTLAAAIRPDNLSEADLRNQKRRPRKNHSDGTS